MPERWQRIKAVFSEAQVLAGTERPAYLEQACRADPELRMEVEALLAAHDRNDAVVDRPAFDYLSDDLAQASAERWVGRRVGTYELIELLGSGGMGEVYRARRVDDQFDKEVAIKLVRSGYDTAFLLRRFRIERQILAGLDHPNIARLLDGGATEEGLPYLVMELVDGEPIHTYCERHALPVPARLRLFREVCAAVAYAHQRLVVHRDLKPGNILVTARGHVKLLDFGIAKLLEAAPGEADEARGTTLLALTPEFASPEQVLGQPITTASDVYSLGVVLFHLLAGRSPYRTQVTSASDALREICEAEPVRPSIAATRVAQPPRAPPGRDLDAITLKALRKEPTRRYGSVEQFSEDVRRYLEGLPVSARGDQLGYRAAKFVRRRGRELAAAVLIVALLIGGIVITSREARIAEQQRQRAERHFASVRSLADTFMFQVNDAITDLPGATAARRILVDTALKYLNALSAETGADRDLQLDLASAYEKVGDLQGKAYSQSLGNPQAALQSYGRAEALLEPLVAAEPNDLGIRASLAQSYLERSRLLLLTGQGAAGVAGSARAVELFESIRTAKPQDTATIDALARASRVHSVQLMYTGQREQGLAYADRAIDILERLGHAQPLSRQEQSELASAYGGAGLLLFSMSPPSLSRALLLERKGLALDESVAASAPVPNAMQLRSLESDRVNIGNILFELHDYRGALEMYGSAHDGFARLGGDINNIEAQTNLAQSTGKLGRALVALGRAVEARDMLLRNAQTLRELAGRADTLQIEFQLGETGLSLGDAYAAQAARATGSAAARDWRAAQDWYRDSAARLSDVGRHVSLNDPDRREGEAALAGVARCDAQLAGSQSHR